MTLSLSYEAGRMAFSGRATTFEELRHSASEHVELRARAEHYAPASRDALHHLERELFELPPVTLFALDPVEPGDAVTLLQGGGERAELELVAAQIARLIGEEGFAAHEIAVVLRDPAPVAALLLEVFGALGVPVAIERRFEFGHTALGRGLVALLRCALLDGSAEDLLAWLRTPGSAAAAGARRRARGRGAPQRRAHRGGGARAVGARELDAQRDRPGRRRARGAARRNCSPSSPTSSRRCSPRRAGARQRC